MAKQPYRMTKLSEIRPYEKNPRIIPQAAVDAVARSIQAFGFRAPIVVDAEGVILAGHTRYKAAQQLGLDTVPVVWQSDITGIQARGYRIADNKVAEIATWDRDALDDEVRELAEIADADLDALGLADWEIQRILGQSGTVEEIFNGVEGGRNSLPPRENARPNANGPAPNAPDGGFIFDAGPDESKSQDARFRLSIIFEKKKDLDEFLDNNRAELVEKFGCNITVGAV